MLLRLALIVPSIREIGGEIGTPYQAGPGHAQRLKLASVRSPTSRPRPCGLAPVFDDKLQQDEALAGVAEPCPGVEMDVQLLIRLDEPEVVEAGGMREAHPRRDLLPARIIGQIRDSGHTSSETGSGP